MRGWNHDAAQVDEALRRASDVTTTRGRVVHDYRLRPHNRDTSNHWREEPCPLLEAARKPHNAPDNVATDLVEYFIVAVPNVESLAGLGPALAKLVKRAAIRILDVVVLVKDDDGAVDLARARRGRQHGGAPRTR